MMIKPQIPKESVRTNFAEVSDFQKFGGVGPVAKTPAFHLSGESFPLTLTEAQLSRESCLN
jgi:hypothetical protein